MFEMLTDGQMDAELIGILLARTESNLSSCKQKCSFSLPQTSQRFSLSNIHFQKMKGTFKK